MKNVTLTIDEDTAQWVRTQAVAREMSVSQFVGEILRERMKQGMSYKEAEQQFFSLPTFRSEETAYPKREDLYDRPRFPR